MKKISVEWERMFVSSVSEAIMSIIVKEFKISETLTTGQNARNKGLHSAQPQTRHLFSNSSLRLRDLCGKGGGKILRARVWEGQRETVSSGHNRTAALLNSTTAVAACARPAQDGYRLHSSMVGEGAHGLPSLTEELWTIDGFWESEFQCSLRVRAPIDSTPVDGPTPRSIWIIPTDTRGLLTKRNK